MLTFIVFIISFALLILLFVMKSYEIYHGRKIFLEELFLKCDAWILSILLKLKFWWSHVNFKNTKRVVFWIVDHVRRTMIAIKRHFDHEQSSFFVKRDPEALRNKKPVSFFLKHVSDYKKSLRENGGGEIEN